MNIGIDLDDTIINTHEILLAYGQKYEFEKLKTNTLVNPYGRLSEEMFNWTEETACKVWKNEGQYEAVLNASPRLLAKEVINDLWLDGNKIYIITARENDWFNDPYEDTKAWFEENEIKYDKIVVGAQGKVDACKELNIDVYIDDKPMNCLSVANAGIKTYVFDNPHNKEFKDVRIKHIYTWIQFKNEIKKILNGNKF